MEKRVVTFRLDKDLYERLLRYAKSRHMTCTQILTQIILDFTNQKISEENDMDYVTLKQIHKRND